MLYLNTLGNVSALPTCRTKQTSVYDPALSAQIRHCVVQDRANVLIKQLCAENTR